MNLEKTNRVNSLLDFYGSLLTQKQYQYVYEYYSDDYSLGEIAENFRVSRQAVYDNLKKTTKTLEGYEKLMHLYSKFTTRNQQLDKLNEYIKKTYPDDALLNQMINHLEKTEEE